MCGILGGLSNNELSKNEYDKRLHLLDHRGPDSSSSYLSPMDRCILVIQDLPY